MGIMKEGMVVDAEEEEPEPAIVGCGLEVGSITMKAILG
jgi:hypothetical protein